jgi:L-lactate dehydrogenase complex protein LldF
MSKEYTEFLEKAEERSFDVAHKQILDSNISKYAASVEAGKKQYHDLELARKRAGYIKNRTIEKLDTYLIEFESNFIKRGGKVIWAQDAEEALVEISKILDKHKVKQLVKSKSMVTEEIGLNPYFEKKKITVTETDLGEYIQQLSKEAPYHIVTPAMHKSATDVAKLFHEKHGLKADASPTDITAFVRNHLRTNFYNAEVGITGANFLLADPGAVVVTENEGNAALSTSFPKVHIVVAGIEKLIPSIRDLDLFLSLLSTYATGQQISVYNHIFTGPKQSGEKDGPEEMYVVLLDNGRSDVLAEPEQRRSLACIKCGACYNVCPVYRHVGGHTYGTVYGGPIGSVISPIMKDREAFKHLSFASTMCGKCTTACPVNIDLHKLLYYNRRDSVQAGLSTKKENWVMYFWKNAMLKRSKMEKGGTTVKNFMLKQFFRKGWGDRRAFPEIAPKSFNQIWKERKGLK